MELYLANPKVQCIIDNEHINKYIDKKEDKINDMNINTDINNVIDFNESCKLAGGDINMCCDQTKNDVVLNIQGKQIDIYGKFNSDTKKYDICPYEEYSKYCTGYMDDRTSFSNDETDKRKQDLSLCEKEVCNKNGYNKLLTSYEYCNALKRSYISDKCHDQNYTSIYDGIRVWAGTNFLIGIIYYFWRKLVYYVKKLFQFVFYPDCLSNLKQANDQICNIRNDVNINKNYNQDILQTIRSNACTTFRGRPSP
jgi:hypothetical protein